MSHQIPSYLLKSNWISFKRKPVLFFFRRFDVKLSTELCIGKFMSYSDMFNSLTPVQNVYNFIDRNKSTNLGLFQSFGISPACHKVNFYLGRFLVK